MVSVSFVDGPMFKASFHVYIITMPRLPLAPAVMQILLDDIRILRYANFVALLYSLLGS